MPPGGNLKDKSSTRSLSENPFTRLSDSMTKSPRRGPGGIIILALSTTFSWFGLEDLHRRSSEPCSLLGALLAKL